MTFTDEPADPADYLPPVPDEITDWYEALSHLGDQVYEANKLAAQADSAQLVDLAGELASVIRRFGDVKKLAASELDSGDKGRRWEVAIPRKAVRTFSARLLNTLALAGETVPQTIKRLIDAGVLVLDWKWTPLDRLAKAQESQLVIVRRPITPDDADHDVGESWGYGYPSYNPIGDQ